MTETAADEIIVAENGQLLRFTFDDLLRYHGPGFPGGVAHGFKAMQAAFPLLSATPPQRRRIGVLTAFTGPGGRDAVEAVTRAVTDGRYIVDRSVGGAGDVIGHPPGPYLWRFTLDGVTVEAAIRPGHVRPEFVALGAKPDRSAVEDDRLEMLKREMAERLVPLDPLSVYAVRRLG